LAWKSPVAPVMPWVITLVFLSIKILMIIHSPVGSP
jgi:hypothetical protein